MNVDQSNTFEFDGFGIPESNYFKMPNIWTDITADINNLAELKVVEYILKHTWGYQEYDSKKRITTDEFIAGRKARDGSRLDKGTGLSAPSVRSGLKKAVLHGLIEEEVDDRDKARIKKYYALRMRRNTQPPSKSEGKHLSSDGKNFTPRRKNDSNRGKESYHRTEKESLETNRQKETKDNNSLKTDDETDVVVALSAKGIAIEVAQQLAATYARDYIQEKIAYLDHRLETNSQAIASPSGWLIRAIYDDYQMPTSSDHHATNNPEFVPIGDITNPKDEDDQPCQHQCHQWLQDLKRDYGTSDALSTAWLRVADGVRSRKSNSLQVRIETAFANSALLTIQHDEALVAVCDQESSACLQQNEMLTYRLLVAEIENITAIKFLLFNDQHSNEDSDSISPPQI